MKKRILLPLAAGALVLALLVGGLPLFSHLVYHRSQAATLLAWQFHKDRYTGPEAFEDYLARKRTENAQPYTLPESVDYTVPAEAADCGDMQVFLLNGGAGGQTVVYFPGGSFIDQPAETHWIFLNALAEAAGCTIYVPIYPKLPEHDAPAAYAVLTDWYAAVFGEDAPAVFMGDSAGGGMALSLAMQLRDAGLPGPDKLILLSPWADVTMTDPEIPDYEKKDPALESEMLRQLGLLWAGDRDPADPMVSPLYGDLSGLGEVILFTTDGELLYPDLLALDRALDAAGTSHRLTERPYMFHCWPLYAYMKIPEAREDQERIVQLLTEAP